MGLGIQASEQNKFSHKLKNLATLVPADCPSLNQWYLANQKTQLGKSAPLLFCHEVCSLFHEPQQRQRFSLISSLFLKTKLDIKEFREAEEFLATRGVFFTENLHNLAIAFLQHASRDEVDRFVQGLVDFAQSSNNDIIRFVAAFTYLNLQKPRECLDICDNISSSSADVLLLEAEAWIDLQNFNEAKSTLVHALEISAHNPRVLFLLGNIALLTDDYEEAWTRLSTLERQNPGQPEVVLHLSLLALKHPRAPVHLNHVCQSLIQVAWSFPESDDAWNMLQELLELPDYSPKDILTFRGSFETLFQTSQEKNTHRELRLIRLLKPTMASHLTPIHELLVASISLHQNQPSTA